MEESESFLGVDSVHMSDVSSSNDFYVFSGYPSSLEKRSVDQVLMIRSCLASNPCDPRIYRKCQCSDASHIVISNPTRNWTDSSLVKIKSFESLGGMSGGGVWKILFDSQPSVKMVLVGIVIEHHRTWGAIVGVRINGIMECIRASYPELGSLIPRSETLDVILQDTDVLFDR
jgi:hypothetical protein